MEDIVRERHTLFVVDAEVIPIMLEKKNVLNVATAKAQKPENIPGRKNK